ncbi:MAG: gamma-glutamylcyclotransferase family protein [Pseudomonadota bacterium]
MTKSYVFGYGSLVNPGTHDYGDVQAARLTGWRRVWRHVEGRSVAFLTITRDAETEIAGALAQVPGQDWAALDQRERSYLRETAIGVTHDSDAEDIRFYHAPEDLHRPFSGHHPILLSYLDAVVQGYLKLGGEDAVRNFFDTTSGWEAPILDDRATPRYPRHQTLLDVERQLVDASLAQRGAILTS